MKSPVIQKRTRRKGAATVEMALTIPVLVMMVVGILEFGRAMMVMNLATNAAREGARMAVIDGSSNTEITTSINTFLKQAIGNSAAGAATTTITVTAATGNPDPGGQVGNAKMRDLITVKVQIPYNSVALVPGKYLAGKKLTGISSMRHE